MATPSPSDPKPSMPGAKPPNPPSPAKPRRDAHLLWPAFTEMVHTYTVPHHLFHDVIAGQRQDLDSPVFETFDQLREYCYRVAGVVGLASIYIWGFQGGSATEALAIDRGIAFQLTNILRDLREDTGRGRVYLPHAELQSHDITAKSLTNGQTPPGFVAMMQSQLSRAAGFYDRSAALESLITQDCRPTLRAMTQIYHGILLKMTADPARVLHERVSLSTVTKLRIAWRAARSK